MVHRFSPQTIRIAAKVAVELTPAAPVLKDVAHPGVAEKLQDAAAVLPRLVKRSSMQMKLMALVPGQGEKKPAPHSATLAAPFGAGTNYRLVAEPATGTERVREGFQRLRQKVKRSAEKLRSSSVDNSITIASRADLQRLSELPLLKDVTDVRLTGNETYGDEDFVLIGQLFPFLTSLRLEADGAGITDAGLAELDGLKLESLELHGADITTAGLEVLRAMPITSLKLPDCRRVGAGVLDHLRGKQIESLDLSGTSLRSISSEMTLKFLDMPLKHLNVAGACRDMSASEHLVLRAMFDDGQFVSDGSRGPRSVEDYTPEALVRLERLYESKRMLHAPSRSWTEREIYGIEPKPNPLAPLIRPYQELGYNLAGTIAGNIAHDLARSVGLEKPDKIIAGVKDQFIAHAFRTNPAIPAALAMPREIYQAVSVASGAIRNSFNEAAAQASEEQARRNPRFDKNNPTASMPGAFPTDDQA